jgi:UDP-4-amino-4,6-dideoxy-N-acetyl-beta-L-altrosamine N-acetyltransferase
MEKTNSYTKKKISLRKITKEDLKILLKWRNTESIWKNNTQFVLLNSKDQIKWYNEINQKKSNRVMFIINYNQKPIGVCGLIHLNKVKKSADIAIIIGETKFQNKGIGKKCLKQLLEYGFIKLDMHRITAEVLEFNINSREFFYKMNFKYEGILRENMWRDGKWHHTEIYSILKNEFKKI